MPKIKLGVPRQIKVVWLSLFGVPKNGLNYVMFFSPSTNTFSIVYEVCG